MSRLTEAGELGYEEMLAQPYLDCAISAGFVVGHPVDTLYLRLQRDGEEPTTMLLRPDEMAAIAWCAAGALYSDHMRRLPATDGKGPDRWPTP